MFLICITHADAQDVPRGQFRALTSAGRDEAADAAKQVEDEIFHAAKQIEKDGLHLITNNPPRIDAIVTSPEARCVETVLVFAETLREYTATSQVEIDQRLMPPTGSPINKDALEKVVTTHHAVQGKNAVVVGLHGDLVVALPNPKVISPRYRADNPDYFKKGPVVAVIMHTPGEPWSNAKVIYCRGPIDTPWQDLLPTP